MRAHRLAARSALEDSNKYSVLLPTAQCRKRTASKGSTTTELRGIGQRSKMQRPIDAMAPALRHSGPQVTAWRLYVSWRRRHGPGTRSRSAMCAGDLGNSRRPSGAGNSSTPRPAAPAMRNRTDASSGTGETSPKPFRSRALHKTSCPRPTPVPFTLFTRGALSHSTHRSSARRGRAGRTMITATPVPCDGRNDFHETPSMNSTTDRRAAKQHSARRAAGVIAWHGATVTTALMGEGQEPVGCEERSRTQKQKSQRICGSSGTSLPRTAQTSNRGSAISRFSARASRSGHSLTQPQSLIRSVPALNVHYRCKSRRRPNRRRPPP